MVSLERLIGARQTEVRRSIESAGALIGVSNDYHSLPVAFRGHG